MSSEVLLDTRGVVISAGDVISIATNRFDRQGAAHDITVVQSVDVVKGVVYLADGEDVDTNVYDVLVLPDDYKELIL